MRHVKLAAAVALFPLWSAAAEPLPGAWLDAKPIVQWNKPGMALPKPPRIDGEPIATGRCAEQLRKPVVAEDKAVMQAGWSLVGALQVLNDRTLISAASAADGMCRPLGNQVFVFVRGRFAGTLSPHAMDARSDGMLKTFVLNEGLIFAEFHRYAAADPLCCPTRTSELSYRLDSGAAGPLLVPEKAETRANAK